MTFKNGILIILFLLSCFFSRAQVSPLNYSQQKKITCNKAAVVCAHPLASNAGLQMLKQGGNAFDAAIATQLALAVVYPGAGNLGGGGFMVAHLKNGKNISLDYREMAPEKASRDMYLDKDGNPIPTLAQQGHLACGVPGTVAGLFAELKYARLDIKKLIAPAIKLAEKGFMITAAQAKSLNDTRATFIKVNKNPVAFVKETEWKEGDTLIQPELASTLKRIRDKGIKGFYEGITAKYIVDEMHAGNGIISLDDLKNYTAKERAVINFDYKGYKIIGMGLPSSGGIILQQMMKMVEQRNIAAMGFQTATSVQLMVEAERRAYADRANFLGDADFIKVPLKTLLSNAYLTQRMNDYEQGKAGNSKSTGAGIVHESEETTHISIIDNEGNAIAITTTLNDSYGSKTVVTGAGFILNDEMDDFSIKEGFPNLYGAVGNAANAIAAHKRMLSSMAPTIVLKNNKPYIVVGSPGGTTITTTVFQTLMNLLEFKLSPEDAVNKAKFHHQWLPDLIDMEKTFPVDISNRLEQMGYTVRTRLPIGRTELIVVDLTKIKKITAVADSRGDDDAQGF